MSDLGPGSLTLPSLERWVDAAQMAAVLGGPPERVELLTHNPYNAVTGGIWRVSAGRGGRGGGGGRGSRQAVVKVLTDGRHHDVPSWWAASEDPSHWNWWRREADAYLDDLARWFRPEGIDAPRLLHHEERGDGTVVLWLEWVEGRHGPEIGVDGLVRFSQALGRVQAGFADGGRHASVQQRMPWLSRGFLGAYSESKPVDGRLFDDDDVWSHARVAHYLGPLREDLRRLHDERSDLVALAAACPRTLCHLDVWPANLARRPDGSFVLFDWAFCGDGALGEDVANLIPDSVFDLIYPVAGLDELAARVEAAYLVGLREGGWEGDERWVRLGMRAAAVKYHWLAERLLVHLDRDERRVYGGRIVPADEMYEARAAGLALLCRWASEARTLATALEAP